ncbi:hypothetical protein SAMN04490243_1895 [Robiginitalea myxolifaciens]|uniref:Uncharacterized protein n=1 Tax=Robiginitalea myxolifaciens TaxID=400055 RepID=A0A1I6GYK8_9FLAO|nr:hypothetical protein [Robiginitalea myxolifaciens]SFR47199.1 hypothetical protein SAMN04490243_1895 [Robiginitalea myxolifaciens]
MARWFVLFFILLVACSTDNENPQERVPEEPETLLDAIVSASVAFSYSGQEVQDFVLAPGQAYVSGYFYFEEDLAEDVIFGLDIEFLEGVENPLRFEGADWMALAGFTRSGLLWFPVGLPENLEGMPTPTENWVVEDLGITLQPGTWYKMTITCDFEALEFISVRLEGGGIDTTVDISGNQLEYPNYAPFDKANLTAYTFALRGQEFAPTNPEGFNVYFDDVEMGVQTSATDFTVVFTDGFESQSDVREIPITDVPIPLETIPEHTWYLENDDAKLSISDHYARTGNYSLECSADLRVNDSGN